MSKLTSISCSSKRRSGGHAAVEVSLLAPWILFLFIGVLDLGFYSYALICTQSAARVAVVFTSVRSATAADSAAACQSALGEMSMMANVRSLSTCNSYPLIVTATAVTGVDGAPASEVAVTYQTDQLIPIPGLLAGRLTVTRRAQMRVQ
jgi:Flp pilus assembly protein TadG